jgi:hypothetical protein
MAQLIYYPLGNADCLLVTTPLNRRFAFDFAAMRNSAEKDDKRIDLPPSFKADIGWPDCKKIDVLAITHGDNDHIKGISDTFWLEHAEKYQGDDRVRFDEMWVPAALIVEEGSKDETRIIRAEARHRFLTKKGIRVFSRPEHLKHWLEGQGKNLDDYRHLITDAGQLAPNWTLENDGVEFFVHSPFAHRTDEGILDRNQNCLVMQAVIRSEGRDTKVLITADSVASEWEKMVSITRAHKNDHRLAWDVFTIPHHCSYLSMAEEKGDKKTQPTPEFEWLLNQGSERSIMISKSWCIPCETTSHPPHLETFRRYEETANALDAELVVTMEHPSRSNPKRLIIEIGSDGATLKKEIITSGVSAVTTRSPRVG